MNFLYTKLEWIYFVKKEIDEGGNINKFTNLTKILYLLNLHFISFSSFNVAKFLSGLIIRSFQNQNFKNYELVFVDDKSIENLKKL